MPCYYPLEGYALKYPRPSDPRFSLKRPQGRIYTSAQVPCGGCVGCKLMRSRHWAIRCLHEASLHEHNSFITLTYNEEHLPQDSSLNKAHFQKFMKRLRKSLHPQLVRFFHAGEYGTDNGRPHYHALLFGYDFSKDRYPWAIREGHQYWRSPLLETAWPFGHAEIGELTEGSAAYVARYCLSKEYDDGSNPRYHAVDLETGEIITREREYVTMSKKPGLGRGWFDKFKRDVYPSDEVIFGGQKVKPPRYYDNALELTDPGQLERIRQKRRDERDLANTTPERLAIREEVAQAKLKLKPRTL